MQAAVQTEAFVYASSVFNGLARTAFRQQENGCGSAVLFNAPRFDIEVSYIAGCVAAELSHSYDRVLLADGRAIVKLAQQLLASVEHCPVRVGKAGVWSLGQHHITESRFSDKNAVPGRVAEVMKVFRAKFDHVVIDVSTLAGRPELEELTREAEGTIVVVRTGCTTEQEVLRCSRAITEAGGKILGSVLTA
jgi:hypothetical protein